LVGVSTLAVGGVAYGAQQADAGSTPASISVPGCSTGVAPGPDLTNVETSFLSGPVVPFGVTISSDSKSAFVADASGAIYVYSLTSGAPTIDKVDSFRLTEQQRYFREPGISPLGLALTPSGRYLVAASASGAVVSKVAGLEKQHSRWSSWSAGTLRSKGQGAIEAAVSPSGAYVFVTLEDSNELAVFDLRSALRKGFYASDLVGTIPLGVAPVGVAVSPNGQYLYVTSESSALGQSEGTLTTIDLARAERAPSHSIVSTVPAGCSPVRVVATSSSVYVTARGSDALLKFNAKDLVSLPGSALEGDVQVGEAPVGLALVDHDKTLVISDSDRFATPGEGANLAVVTVAEDGQMLLDGYLKSGSFPRDVAASPNGEWLLVSNYGSSQVEAVDARELP
jgi:DNA-binding beta-propeller fold protein YncE